MVSLVRAAVQREGVNGDGKSGEGSVEVAGETRLGGPRVVAGCLWRV